MTEDNASRHEIKFDLQGLIRLLAKNLYAEPDVFVRELVQNAHDSLQRRHELDGDAAPPGQITIDTDYRAATITFADNGNGLTEAEIHDYLSTIGRSGTGAFRQELAKRGRQAEVSLIGQFGIGLLSAFVVAHRVEVETRSARPDNPAWRWVSEGQQDYQLLPGTRSRPGTSVILHIADNYRDMLDPEQLAKAVKKYADFIPFPIVIDGAGAPANAIDAPWHRSYGDEQERLGEYWVFITRRFPDMPLEVIPVELHAPQRVSGVLYISDHALPDINTAGLIDVYQTRMFLMAQSRDLLPSWAKFVRGIIDAPGLTPTASRDAIQLDSAAREIRDALGQLIVRHLQELAGREPDRFARIMEWHSYHMTGMAVTHDDFFDAVADLVPFETNRGRMNLAEYLARAPHNDDLPGSDLFYFSERGSATQFYLLCDARGLLVIDASRNFDADFLRKYAQRRKLIRLHHITVAGSNFLFDALDRSAGAEFRQLVLDFQALLPDSRSQARAVRFQPTSLPAVTVLTADTRLRGDLDSARRSATLPDSVRDLAGRLFKDHESAPLILHLNADNPTIRHLAALARRPQADRSAYDAAIAAIFNNALLLAQQKLSPDNAAAIVAGFNRVVELLMEQTERLNALTLAPPEPPTAPDAPAEPVNAPQPLSCAAILPAGADALWDALVKLFERAPYYWRLNRVANPDELAANRSAAYLCDISSGEAQTLMLLGYLRWGVGRGDAPIFVLERAGSREQGAALDETIRLSYPDAGAADIAAALAEQLRGQPAIARLRAGAHAHALSPRLLFEQLEVDAPLVAPLVAAYPTLEALAVAPVDEVVRQVPGLSRSLARGLQAEIADLLQQARRQ